MGIWFWTDRKWSETRADAYLREMWEEFSALAPDPRRGRQPDNLPRSYWVRRFRSHYIFFLRERDGVEFVRVLHGQMDFAKHLKDDE
jgi:toxin ParE1/3/4